MRQANLLRRTLRPILKKAGVPAIHPFDLRHTAATILLSREVNINVVSERLGHDSVTTTLKQYAHARPSMQQKAAEVVEALFSQTVPNKSPEEEFLIT